jgi:hypothetical protein
MNRRVAIRFSLALNLLLAGLCVWLYLDREPRPFPTGTDRSATRPIHGETATEAALWTNAAPVTKRRGWTEVLRDQGVPEKVVARLALADFDDRWQARQSEAQQAYNRGDVDADALAALDVQHDVEQESYLQSVLGPEAFRQWDENRLFQQFNLAGLGLTPAESNSLYGLTANLRDRQRALNLAKLQNQVDQAALEAGLQAAQTNFDQAVRTLLGDQRYGALHGTDPVIGDLRRGLTGMEVDPGQFSTLLQAQQSWETNRAQLEEQQVETGDTNLDPQIDAAAAARDQTFEEVLGTNGYAAFKKSQDSRYLEMVKNAARWGMDDSQIDYVYDEIQAYERTVSDSQARARALEIQGTSVDWPAFQQQMQAYGQQLANQLRGQLGDASYQAVLRNRVLPFGAQ